MLQRSSFKVAVLIIALAVLGGPAYSRLELPGFDWIPACGIFIEGIVCTQTDVPMEHVRARVERALAEIGVGPERQRWRTFSTGFEVEWGEGDDDYFFFSNGWMETGYREADRCLHYYGIDPFEWASRGAGGGYYETGMMIMACVGFDRVDEHGQTPLFYAITADSWPLVNFLVEYAKLDPNHRTLAGWTPIMYAARDASGDVVQELLDAGADPTVAAPDGTTAAMLAAGNPRLGSDARALLGRNPD